MRRHLLVALAALVVVIPACATAPELPAFGLMPTPLGGAHEPPPELFESPAARNGCDDVPLALPPEGPVVISFGGVVGERYSPRCTLAEVGTRIEFRGDFAAHPMAGGVVFEGAAYRDPQSEVPYTKAGTEAGFVPLHPGVYAFYCQIHWVLGMRGSVIVE